MTREQARDFASLAVRLARLPACADWSAERVACLAEWFRYRAAACQRYAEAECSRPVTEAETKRNENREESIRRVALEHGLTARFQGDPRGFVVRLVFPGDPPGEGFGVA